MVPARLFTRGWIYVLEDTELAFLLMLAYHLLPAAGQPFTVQADTRVLRFGIGRDAYLAHKLFSHLQIAVVKFDHNRRRDGTVGRHRGRDSTQPVPHTLQFLLGGLDRDGLDALTTYLHRQLKQ